MLADPALRDLMTAAGGWYGLPALIYRGRVLDGRRRIAIATAYHLPVRRTDAATWNDAARMLTLAGHDDRAVELLREQGLECSRASVALLRLAPSVAARLLASWRTFEQRARPQSRSGPKRLNARVVTRLRQLVADCEERGTDATLAELQAIMADAPRAPKGTR